MSSDKSVTDLIRMLKAGDRRAAQGLWEAYFQRLIGLARAQLARASTMVADAEDVALSAFDSFYRRAERGEFPRLEDRDDLWQLLFVLTVRKAINLVRYQGRKSRGSGRLVSLSDLEGLEADLVLSAEPSPEFAAEMVDECRRLLDLLPDATLRSVALGAETGSQLEAISSCDPVSSPDRRDGWRHGAGHDPEDRAVTRRGRLGHGLPVETENAVCVEEERRIGIWRQIVRLDSDFARKIDSTRWSPPPAAVVQHEMVSVDTEKHRVAVATVVGDGHWRPIRPAGKGCCWDSQADHEGQQQGELLHFFKLL